jgi:hypothetical protein
MTLEIQFLAWDRSTYVMRLNRLMGSKPSTLVCFVDIGWNDDHPCLNFLFMPYWTTPTPTISLARFLSFCLFFFFWKFWHWRIHNIIVYYRYICFFILQHGVKQARKASTRLAFLSLNKNRPNMFFFLYISLYII